MSHAKPRLLLPVLALSAIAMSAYALANDPPPAALEAAPVAAPNAPAAPPGQAPAAKLVSLENEFFRIDIAPSTGLAHVVMKDERYERGGKPIDLVSTNKPAYLPLRITAKGIDLPAEQRWELLEATPSMARFQLVVGDVTFVRKLELGKGPYQLWSTLRIENAGAAARKIEVSLEGHHYVRRVDEKGGFLAGRSPLMASGLCVHDDDPERVQREDIVDDKPSFTGKVSFGSVDDLYFTQAIAADGAPFARCALTGDNRGNTQEDPEGSLLSVKLDYAPAQVPANGRATLRSLAYLGPKLPEHLAQAGHGLTRANFQGGLPGVDTIAHSLVGLLAAIHSYIPNWGLAIILLTFLVKAVLFPLTAKSFESIASMRRLKPEIDAINEKFADDREKKGAAMMELYRKHKINPFGGCLPQLLQLPIWWALYMSLSSNVELFKRPFFAIWQDLSAPDPWYVLPLALGALMWVQQKITPSTMDPAQAKMMLYVMPAMITAFMLFLPAGLCLYMLTNSLLSIGQQRFIEHRLAQKSAATAAASSAAGSSSDAGKGPASPGRTGRGRA